MALVALGFFGDDFHNEPGPEFNHWLVWISSRVAQARANRGWTIEQTAKMANIPSDYLLGVEAGINSPGHLVRKKLAYALECDETYFEDYTPPVK